VRETGGVEKEKGKAWKEVVVVIAAKPSPVRSETVSAVSSK
jgi:hypothetical protein